MKSFFVAVMAVVLLAIPAAAQVGGSKRNQPGEGPKVQQGPKVDEKAYKAALERIPDPKEKYDPWGGVAPAPATAAKKK